MRTTPAFAALAATTALIGLGTTTAEARVDNPRAEVVKEKGIVLECTGKADGLAAYVNLYENDTYSNYVQVILADDPELANSREPADILDAGQVRTGVRIAGKQARVRGTATRVGPKKHVHEEYDDAGQHIVADGFHRRLAYDLVLRYDGITVPLECAPAFYYSLNVTKTDTTGE
ncbi:hypothetical protein NSZ01_01200 [Nocardioides szechwanensis]|uniref:Uncharacterized protein n=1 Tax=Nocardioides szechwanensis TaxID=1005944 RepID=A0A1G9XDT6_9ACTN|nr:hypothetical protein [Nocardioides szechwanensis]GEP32352.1 hypothetical protein NSZ01_01200 [Nocardioides szechwanensis]SDM94701.1 hypothetical protein SAMN05192576_1334 [Nocardioides szechwanensis]